MAIDTATIEAIGLDLGKQFKGEALAALDEAQSELTPTDRQIILETTEAMGILAARQYAGQDVADELAQRKAVIASYQDFAASLARRISRERVATMAEEAGLAALKIAGTIAKGLVPGLSALTG